MAVVTAIALALLVLGWKELKATTFDPVFAASIGLPVRVLDAAMTAMIAVAVVLGLQMVGVVLMSAMVVAPAVAARQWTRRLEAMVVLAALFGAAGGVAGGLISATGSGLSTGPLIVLALTAIVMVSLAAAPERGLVRDALRHRRASRALRANQLLAALHRLTRHHGDPTYATEQGMLDALFGARTRGPLRRLEKLGLVEEVRHRPEENAHWALTDEGRDEALHLSKHGPSGAAEARS
jgi:manganese/zinc/iron transport system permease protein